MDNDDEFNKMKQYLHVGAILKLYNKIKITINIKKLKNYLLHACI